MGRKSTVSKLDTRLRDAVDALVRDGRYTLDEILEHLADLNGGKSPVSRSALGRYTQAAEEQMRRYREAQEVAKVWVNKLEDEPNGDVARLLPEMLRSVAFQTIGSMSDREEGADAQELMFLAKALDHLGKANTASLQIEIKLREIRNRVKDAAIASAKAEGMSGEQAERMAASIASRVQIYLPNNGR